MQSDKMIQQPVNTIRTKSIESDEAMKSGHPGERSHPTTPVAHWKRWHFKSSIILMLIGACAVIVYLLRSGLGKELEGLGAALCAVVCGGFLVWHTIHLFAEQDALEQQQPYAPQATAAPPQADLAGQETKPSHRV